MVLRLRTVELRFAFLYCCLQGAAGLSAVLHCILQHQPDPNSLMLDTSVHPLTALLQLPNAQHISAADMTSAMKLPLQQGNDGYTQLLCQQPAAQALQVDDIFDLLCSAVQHKAVSKSERKQVWVEDCERLLSLPAAAELTAEHIEELLHHMQSYEVSRYAAAVNSVVCGHSLQTCCRVSAELVFRMLMVMLAVSMHMTCRAVCSLFHHSFCTKHPTGQLASC
jgi:hypothetical protein